MTTDVTQDGTAGPVRLMLVGLQAVVSSRASRVLVALSVLASFVYGTDTVLFVGVSQQQLQTGPKGFGYLLAGLGIGGILMAPFVNRLAASLRKLVARVFGVFFALVLAAISVGALIAPPPISGPGLHAAEVILAGGPALLSPCAYPALRRMDSAAVARLRELEPEPRIELLDRLGIFAAATRPVPERLAAASVPVTIAAGDTILREGDPADARFAIVDGEVRVTSQTALGEPPREIRTMGPGSYFGEIGVLRVHRPQAIRLVRSGTERMTA